MDDETEEWGGPITEADLGLENDKGWHEERQRIESLLDAVLFTISRAINGGDADPPTEEYMKRALKVRNDIRVILYEGTPERYKEAAKHLLLGEMGPDMDGDAEEWKRHYAEAGLAGEPMSETYLDNGLIPGIDIIQDPMAGVVFTKTGAGKLAHTEPGLKLVTVLASRFAN